MIKTFDCIELKNYLQKKLYEELKPEDLKDYCEKMKEKRQKSNLFKDLQKKYNKT